MSQRGGLLYDFPSMRRVRNIATYQFLVYVYTRMVRLFDVGFRRDTLHACLVLGVLGAGAGRIGPCHKICLGMKLQMCPIRASLFSPKWDKNLFCFLLIVVLCKSSCLFVHVELIKRFNTT